MKKTGKNAGKKQGKPSPINTTPQSMESVESADLEATAKESKTENQPAKRMIDFMGRRKIWYLISLIIIIPGIISLAVQGLNLGIDFTGGSMLHIQVANEQMDTGQLRTAVDSLNLEKAAGIQSSGPQEFIIRTPELSQEEMNTFVAGLQERLGELQVLRHENVGAIMGSELARNAFMALGIAAVLMLIYISFRFEWKFGLAAILDLLQDALIVVGIFSWFQIEVNGTFVAAILTVLGYSINDTIVIFDRIRENQKLLTRISLDELVNKSINQTLVRSINTGLTVIFCLIALLIFGGDTIKDFSLALLLGVTVGVFSSICIASSLWLDFMNSSRDRGKRLAQSAR